MFNNVITSIVISFVLRQIEKFQKTIDWVKVKSDADIRVRALIPGTWLDDEASNAVAYMLDTLQVALSSKNDFNIILKLLANKKYEDAGVKLKDLLICAWSKNCQNQTAKAMVLGK